MFYANDVNKSFITLIYLRLNRSNCTAYILMLFLIIVIASLNYYKPKFNWDSLDKLSALDRFKSECEVLFVGPLDESLAHRQAGLVVNWVGSEAGLTLRSLHPTYDHPDTIFYALIEVFRPIGNRTISWFKFKSLKQKQGATVDSYMAELKVLICECGYEENMQNILLKDQFIFGVMVREIQEHLLNEIGHDHDINQCLQEARKIESCIAQCKLLGLKSVQYNSIGQRNCGRSKKKSKSKDRFKSRSQSSGGIKDCKYCGSSHQCRQCPAYGKIVRHDKNNHFAKKCWSSKGQGQSSGGTKHKSFKHRELNWTKSPVMTMTR